MSWETQTLNRLRNALPIDIHRELYYTLFESHLTYCISVWGGSAQKNLESLWTSQKKCVRSLFGDYEAYQDKFKTACRTRSIDRQQLGQEFFALEHTKPLFKEHKIMSLHNLYTYHCFMETFKILKFRTPISLFSEYTLSTRKPTTIITASPSKTFIDSSSLLWNTIAPKLKLHDYSAKVNIVKSKLKNSILTNQHCENKFDWTCEDHNARNLKFGDP